MSCMKCVGIYGTGGRSRNEKGRIPPGYQVNDTVMRLAREDVMVMHCLPVHREEEIIKIL